MAKTNTIQVFRSTTASAVPGASALSAGELAVNLTDKKLFVGDAAGTSYIELTRLAAAASSTAGALKLQLADTNGYLTGPHGILYYDTVNDRLVATSMEFGSTVFYSSGNDRIMEAGGNPSRRIHIRQVSGGDIHIGDSGLQGNTTIGFSVQENNLAMFAYGDVFIEPDAGANSTGDLNTRLIRIRDANELRFGDADDSNYVGFKAPSTVSTNKIWTLPSADGTSGQVLSTNGSGTLSWTGVASVSGSDTQVIFNDGGSAFGADAGLTYNKTTDTLTIAGDLAVNGGDLTTTATGTATLFNTNATTLNIGGAATAITIGASTGTTTFANGIVAPAGTTTLAPFKMQSGTNLTSATSGAFEYDGKCFYNTTQNGRGLTPVEHFAVVSSTRTISNVNTDQAVFDSANDSITLAANTTYFFEGFYRVISGTTSHTTNMSFTEASVGAFGTWYWMALVNTAAVGTVSRAQDSVVFSSSAGGATNASSGTALVTIWFRGTVETGANAVSVTPNIKFSAQPGGTNQIGAGTFIRFTPVGTDTVQSVGPWA